MLRFSRFDAFRKPSPSQRRALGAFLHEHLGQYGDPLKDILRAIDFAIKDIPSFGGMILVAREESELAGIVVMNATGMSGYVPENILVYIAVDQTRRGQGIGQRLLEYTFKEVDGAIALHVESDNPARRLYERVGFENPYLEMRYKPSASS